MVILTELEEVNQIVEVAVDVNLSENAYGENHPRQFPGNTLLEKTLISRIS